MKIYIASSWKNQHAVEMLTDVLRERGHEVLSFVENNHGEHQGIGVKPLPFDEWVNSEQGKKSFEYDTTGASTSQVVIYIGPSGCDAWAEVGIAWAKGATVIGLHAKGEPVGLMRRLVSAWCCNYRDVLDAVGRVQR